MNSIDWKHLATTKGYKSLKSAYIKEVSLRPRKFLNKGEEEKYKKYIAREKLKAYNKFQWVIARARHYAHHTGKSVESILKEWEESRKSWWFGYYSDQLFPKFHSNSKKPMGINGFRKYYKKSYCSEQAKDRVCYLIEQDHIAKSVKKKKRWPMARKKLHKRSL